MNKGVSGNKEFLQIYWGINRNSTHFLFGPDNNSVKKEDKNDR